MKRIKNIVITIVFSIITLSGISLYPNVNLIVKPTRGMLPN